MNKLSAIHVYPKEGGFLVRATVQTPGPEILEDEYIVSSYGKLIKAIKQELQEFAPKRKEKVNADQA